MDSNFTWLKAQFVDKDFSKCAESEEVKSDLDSKLLELLSETKCVTNKNVLKYDMEERFSRADFRLANGLYLPHCKTNGVSDLCFSVIIDKTDAIYGMIAIPDYTNSALKRLASIVDLLSSEKLISTIKAKRKAGDNDLTQMLMSMI